ncbi:zinc finger CCCH domain-containing protein 18-like isoform X1 [Silene latifolia]|uniref:zinc finger CCCH domain-containing protein 18-like isoform X1 n=1 Tax=Silene latifolia TaxID=37657 RepID=UPI003D787B6B
MDLSDATKVLLDRIQKLEPEIATKIMGCILIQDHGEREMIRLAYAPEKLLEKLVQKTKLQLGFLAKSPVSTSMSPPISINLPPVSENPMSYMPFSPNGSQPYSYPPTIRVPPYWDPSALTHEQHQILNSEFESFRDSSLEDSGFQNPTQYMGFEDQMDPISVFYEGAAALGNLNMRRNRRSANPAEYPAKMCHYFNKGFCKHGNSCRYLHGSDNFSPVFSSHELRADDHLFSPGSLEKLEVEISELLSSARGPVSIASLPMLYCEKYGRMLQAEGYLTESQRHGRAGYSLTKLLARLKTIRLIDRPHGQHAVILAEDASKYNVDNRSERNDVGSAASGSRQIYLTFPAESTFTEDDVSDYFGEFGTVEDVRIPCQQKRMFGFVTFASPNTVKTVLAKGNPHFVSGSRVLVKPYREKSKLVERKYMDKNDHGMHYRGNYLDLDHEFHPMAPRFLRRQLMEQQEQALEMERRRLSELQFGRKNMQNRQFIGYGMEEQQSLEDAPIFSSVQQYRQLFDAINNGSAADDRSKHLSTDFTEQESQGINLPENPFASAIGSSIPAII